MTTMTTITSQFEGRALTTITYKGKPAWIARDVGAALGYEQDGRRLVNLIRDEWADEFIDGADYALIAGKDLRDLKAALATGHAERVQSNTTDPESRGQSELLGSRARSVLVLFESGVYAVCLKTDKPEGRRLRRFLVDEVLPQLARTGRYEPERKTREPRRETADEREARLRRKLELEERKLKREALLAFDAMFGDRLGPDARQALHAKAVEYVTGEPIPMLLPHIPESWESATQIAARWEYASAGLVGTIVSRIPELKDRVEKPGLVKVVLDQSRYSSKQVATCLYSKRAVAMIEEGLREYFASDAGKKSVAKKQRKAERDRRDNDGEGRNLLI